MGEGSEPDSILAGIAALDLSMKESCNLIPLQHWGLSDSIKEQLKQRKHSILSQVFSKKDKKNMSNARKQKLARNLGAVPMTVSEVLDWMESTGTNDSDSSSKKVKGPLAKGLKPTTRPGHKAKVQTVKAKPVVPPVPAPLKRKLEEESDSSDDEENDEETNAAANTTTAEDQAEADESGSEVDESDDESEHSENEEEKEVQENGHAEEVTEEQSTPAKTADVTSEKVEKTKAKEPKTSAPLAKKQKIDKELAELEKVDTSKLDPLEAREIAMKKLKMKIESMKTQRRGKKSAEDYEAQRKLKRRMSKLQMKQKKGQQKPVEPQPVESGEQDAEKKADIARQAEALKSEKAASIDGIAYSKFDFIVKGDKDKLSKKEKRDKFTGKDYKRLLQKAEARSERIEKVRERDPWKASRIEENIKWNKAIALASGEKVKDDVERLQKALKRKEKKKEKTHTKWNERTQDEENKKQRRIEAREENLQKRKDKKKNSKIEKMKKKGRVF